VVIETRIGNVGFGRQKKKGGFGFQELAKAAVKKEGGF